MDRSAVALLIAERAALPVVVMSEASDLLLLSPSAEQALGIGAGSLGGTWIERSVQPTAAVRPLWYRNRAVTGPLRKQELPQSTPRGTSVAHFDAQPVGRDRDGGRLLLLERLVPVPREPISTDYYCEVAGVTCG